MTEKPKLVSIILCELILQDLLRREAISCVNIHSGIMTQAFPVHIPLIFAFAQVAGVKNTFNYQFKITDPKGNLMASSPVAKVDPLPNENVTHKIINAFTGLVFNEEGSYTVSLVVDGEDVGFTPFQVVQVTPQAVA